MDHTKTLEQGRNFIEIDRAIMEQNACPNCFAVDPFFTGPRGGESVMMVCDNCYLEVTNHRIIVVNNGLCDNKRLKAVYSRIPSMKGENPTYLTLTGEEIQRIRNPPVPWWEKVFSFIY